MARAKAARRAAAPAAAPAPDRQRPADLPAFRRLRIYAFDPSLSTQLDTAAVNVVTVNVRWEAALRADESLLASVAGKANGPAYVDLQPGPVGEYLEVIDYDPASKRLYAPVDLNERAALAQDGLPPSEGNPRFHQQMVYAVAMTTIRHFERALGRLALWSPYRPKNEFGRFVTGGETFVRRLRIYPHALRVANAYYSPEKKALLFGYFPAAPLDPAAHLPGGMVFTCLSHDIIAHETSHALLDGLHERFRENSNPDVLAFHEAFADIVAIFQHFSMPGVVRHQIARTRGDLQRDNYLGVLAAQFGTATGRRGALRSAINRVDPQTGRPDPTEYARVTATHDRGAILVAAVFDAFAAIYRARIAPIVRAATGGSGVLAAGELHPDLVDLLATQAAKAAGHVLNMCIRALDYCPPVDLTFGEYLRAMITADRDLVPDDDLRYRVAFIEAFRQRGIYPRDVRTMSEESLLWSPPLNPDRIKALFPSLEEIKARMPPWDMTADRQDVSDKLKTFRKWLNARLSNRKKADGFADGLAELGLDAGLNPAAPRGPGRFEVHSARPARRIGPDGQQLTDLVVVITQGRPVYFKEGADDWRDPRTPYAWDRDKAIEEADFWYRGGSTLILDLQNGEPRYCIYKSILNSGNADRDKINSTRFQRQLAHEWEAAGNSLAATYFAGYDVAPGAEPFAMLHDAVDESSDIFNA